MNHLYLDCDGVLLDWEESFKQWLLYDRNMIVEGRPKDWDLSIWLNTSPNEALQLVEDFNRSPSFAWLDQVQGAHEALQHFARRGIPITVLTCCGDHPWVAERRRQNLREHYETVGIAGPVFTNVVCLPLGARKGPLLSALDPGIWVEDNYHHAIAGAERGHRTYMMRYPHNEKHEAASNPAITWVSNWHEIVSDIFSR